MRDEATDLAYRRLEEALSAAREPGGRALLLDGAMGTALEARGVPSELPLWSARALLEAPEAVREVHRAHAAAGADGLTTNTFRTQARTLAHAGAAGRAGELTRLAVRLAREAAEEAPRRPFVLGSAAPLEDCYHPERVPSEAALAHEHGEHARHLTAAGVDAILIETMNTAREAAAAGRAAREAGAPFLISFVCGPAARLLSGEPLAEALGSIAPLAPMAVGVNCLAPTDLGACLPVLAACGLPFAVYPNLGPPEAALEAHWPPGLFAAEAAGWLEAGAVWIGGCCGTLPAHTAALREILGAD